VRLAFIDPDGRLTHVKLSGAQLVLGIDVGTTKLAVAVLDDRGQLKAAESREHGADVDAGCGRSEQDAQKLLDSARELVRSISKHLRNDIAAVGVTGQMHGAVLLDGANRALTRLITWQDKRCDEDFLAELERRTGHRLETGYGCATLAWLCARGELPLKAAAGATLHDWLAAQLCSARRPVTDPTDAAGWGLFDRDTGDWDWAAVEAAGIERELLPRVAPCGSLAGRLSAEAARAWGLSDRTPVAVALGDNQASVLATVTEPATDIALTLGTGAQVSLVLDQAVAVRYEDPPRCELRPFVGGRALLVGASLAGGSAWAQLARSVAGWLTDLGAPKPPRDELYETLNELGLAATDALTVTPTFVGERFDKQLRGAIGGVDMDNFSLGHLARGLARGIAANLKAMLPAEALAGRRRIVGSGNALRRNPLLQEMVRQVFGLPLELSTRREQAACGAAIHSMALL